MDSTQDDFFQLKADFIPLTVIKLTQHNIDGIQSQLIKTIHKAPKYFQQAPVLIDLSELKTQHELDIEGLLSTFRNHQLIPVAIRGIEKEIEQKAQQQGLAILKKSSFKEEKSATTPVATTKSHQSLTKIITKPIRAGTQVYAKGGDLIILAAVNPGAECFADGNIHVHGPLRGRALAGINGDNNARIFCKSLEAELIAIAGYYQINEKLAVPTIPGNGMIQIYLENEKLQITTI
ncbi:MAG: septum site-determining protein MinC [Coxiella sp. RIFCSPHIGHO2_12_FULL_42_15]|nr:MAG: septum site-determining protein MinC [Coxiella sp. RIFCSPHIGHO2_12_FULL_42_15]